MANEREMLDKLVELTKKAMERPRTTPLTQEEMDADVAEEARRRASQSNNQRRY